jgi:hypothetical protein
MTQPASVAMGTGTGVRELWAFSRVKFWTIRALFAISHIPKSLAVLCCWIQADMREAAVVVVAATFLEVQTGWGVVWGGLVGKRTSLAFRAVASKPVPTRRLLIRIVGAKASVPGTHTCTSVSVKPQRCVKVSPMRVPVMVNAGQRGFGRVCC